jgi:hypothetical protein
VENKGDYREKRCQKILDLEVGIEKERQVRRDS